MMCDSLAVMIFSKYLHTNTRLGVFDYFAPVFCQKHVKILWQLGATKHQFRLLIVFPPHDHAINRIHNTKSKRNNENAMSTSRIGNPVLYQWDLNENSTRYDYPRSRPADEVLQIQLSISAFVNAVVAVASFILILAILKSQKLRSNAFNLYILFMAIPDFIGSFFCLLTCAMSAPGSDFYSEAMCGFQAFYLIFAFTGNAWTNVIIFHQVNKLLDPSIHKLGGVTFRRQGDKCFVMSV